MFETTVFYDIKEMSCWDAEKIILSTHVCKVMEIFFNISVVNACILYVCR